MPNLHRDQEPAGPWPSSHRLHRRVGSAWRFRPFSAFGRRDSATGRAGLVTELGGIWARCLRTLLQLVPGARLVSCRTTEFR
jgi:hypothetical protein